MGIVMEPFGKTAGAKGENVEKYILSNEFLSVSLISFGARIQAIEFCGRDIALGYDTLAEYENDRDTYFGAVVGRYANRIAAGKFSLNGKKYDVGRNEKNICHLHGGKNGLDRKIWLAVCNDGEAPEVTFKTRLNDGEEGYPAGVDISVSYKLCENRLELKYDAVSDGDTVINLTNHCYFNPDGHDGESVLNDELTVFADRITPVDKKLIPTGKFEGIAGTAFDFRLPKIIGKDINADDNQLAIGKGYDHNFVLAQGINLHPVARVHSPHSGITIDCFTDQPGIQIYTGNCLLTTSGKGGKPYPKHQGICLETQHFPDSPNHPRFPSTLLTPDKKFTSHTVFTFTAPDNSHNKA